MAKPVAPMPVQTPCVDSARFTLTWERWLKTVSDFAVDAGKVSPSAGFAFGIVGSLVHAEYDGIGGVTLELPFSPVGKLWADVCTDGTWSKVEAIAGADRRYRITLPAGASVQTNVTFFTSSN